MRKCDIETHNSGGCGGPYYPAVNVKVHRLGYDADDIAERLGCSEAEAQHALDIAFQMACERFWEDAPELAEYALGEPVKVYSAGRSGGWLIVDGLPDIESWDAVAVARWAKLCRVVRAEIDYQLGLDQVCEAIECNQWADLDAEQYNLIDRGDGSVGTVAECKRAERAAKVAYLAGK